MAATLTFEAKGSEVHMATVRTSSLQYSKERVKKAGATVRAFATNEPLDRPDLDTAFEAIEVIEAFRAAHQYPLTRVAVGLRSMVRTTGADPVVAQRLKRMPQIINKLFRLPSMSLARMEDVGGCRAVLRNEEEVRRVLARIERYWDVKYLNDYIATPKDTGYRGIHAVVTRDERWIDQDGRHVEGTPRAAYTDRRAAGRPRTPSNEPQIGPECPPGSRSPAVAPDCRPSPLGPASAR